MARTVKNVTIVNRVTQPSVNAVQQHSTNFITPGTAQYTVLLLMLLLLVLEVLRHPVLRAFIVQHGPWGTFIQTANSQVRQTGAALQSGTSQPKTGGK